MPTDDETNRDNVDMTQHTTDRFYSEAAATAAAAEDDDNSHTIAMSSSSNAAAANADGESSEIIYFDTPSTSASDSISTLSTNATTTFAYPHFQPRHHNHQQQQQQHSQQQSVSLDQQHQHQHQTQQHNHRTSPHSHQGHHHQMHSMHSSSSGAAAAAPRRVASSSQFATYRDVDVESVASERTTGNISLFNQNDNDYVNAGNEEEEEEDEDDDDDDDDDDEDDEDDNDHHSSDDDNDDDDENDNVYDDDEEEEEEEEVQRWSPSHNNNNNHHSYGSVAVNESEMNPAANTNTTTISNSNNNSNENATTSLAAAAALNVVTLVADEMSASGPSTSQQQQQQQQQSTLYSQDSSLMLHPGVIRLNRLYRYSAAAATSNVTLTTADSAAAAPPATTANALLVAAARATSRRRGDTMSVSSAASAASAAAATSSTSFEPKTADFASVLQQANKASTMAKDKRLNKRGLAKLSEMFTAYECYYATMMQSMSDTYTKLAAACLDDTDNQNDDDDNDGDDDKLQQGRHTKQPRQRHVNNKRHIRHCQQQTTEQRNSKLHKSTLIELALLGVNGLNSSQDDDDDDDDDEDEHEDEEDDYAASRVRHHHQQQQRQRHRRRRRHHHDDSADEAMSKGHNNEKESELDDNPPHVVEEEDDLEDDDDDDDNGDEYSENSNTSLNKRARLANSNSVQQQQQQQQQHEDECSNFAAALAARRGSFTTSSTSTATAEEVPQTTTTTTQTTTQTPTPSDSEFHLCKLCLHALTEPITLVCGCSFCKQCLNEYNALLLSRLSQPMTQHQAMCPSPPSAAFSFVRSQQQQQQQQNEPLVIAMAAAAAVAATAPSSSTSTSGAVSASAPPLMTPSSSTSTTSASRLFACYQCGASNEQNTTDHLRPNVTLIKLIEKLWHNNTRIRKLRNDIRAYAAHLIGLFPAANSTSAATCLDSKQLKQTTTPLQLAEQLACVQRMLEMAYDMDPSNHLLLADMFMLSFFALQRRPHHRRAHAHGRRSTTAAVSAQCLHYAERACELKPNWPFAFYMKAVYYAECGERVKMREALDMCARLGGASGDARLAERMNEHSLVFDKTRLGLLAHSTLDSMDTTSASTSVKRLHHQHQPKQQQQQRAASKRLHQRAAHACDGDADADAEAKDKEVVEEGAKEEAANAGELSSSTLHYDTRRYVVVDAMLVKANELECSLCYRLLYKPVTTPCGHSFCCSCLDRSLDHQDKCPLCKHSLVDYLAERRQFVTVFVDRLIRVHYTLEHAERERQHADEMRELSNGDNEIPVFVCALALPCVPCLLHIYEPRYKLMIRRAIESGANHFGMCMYSEKTAYYYTEYGCLLDISNYQFIRDGRAMVTSVGARRFRVLSSANKDGYSVARVEWIADVRVTDDDERLALQTLHDEVYALAQHLFAQLPENKKSQIYDWYGISELPAPEADIQASDNGPLWHWFFLHILPLESEYQYKFLTKQSLKERLRQIKRIIFILTTPSEKLRQMKMSASVSNLAATTGATTSSSQTASASTSSTGGDNEPASSSSSTTQSTSAAPPPPQPPSHQPESAGDDSLADDESASSSAADSERAMPSSANDRTQRLAALARTSTISSDP